MFSNFFGRWADILIFHSECKLWFFRFELGRKKVTTKKSREQILIWALNKNTLLKEFTSWEARLERFKHKSRFKIRNTVDKKWMILNKYVMNEFLTGHCYCYTIFLWQTQIQAIEYCINDTIRRKLYWFFTHLHPLEANLDSQRDFGKNFVRKNLVFGNILILSML